VFFVGPPKAAIGVVVSFGFVLGVVQFGLLFFAIHIGMPAGLSSLVIQMQVFFTIALAYFILNERPTTWQVVGGCVAVVGVGVIAIWKAKDTAFAPFMLVLGAALAWAVANIITKRAGRINMLPFIVWASLVAPLPLFTLSLLIEGPDAVASALLHPTWTSVGAIAFLAYPTTVLGFSLWNRLLSRYPAAMVAPFGLLVPMAGIMSTSLLLGEPFGAVETAGSMLVMAGLALNVFSSRLAQPRAIPAQSKSA
jgi:O-acetylserine/cysteine efflux transporter